MNISISATVESIKNVHLCLMFMHLITIKSIYTAALDTALIQDLILSFLQLNKTKTVDYNGLCMFVMLHLYFQNLI